MLLGGGGGGGREKGVFMPMTDGLKKPMSSRVKIVSSE